MFKHLIKGTIWVLVFASLAACDAPQDQVTPDQTAPVDAVAVHQAETAAGKTADLMSDGENLYKANCAACHQADGTGLKGAFPHMHSPDDLHTAVEAALSPTDDMRIKLKQYRDYFFTGLDGDASGRVKAKIDQIVKGVD